MDEEGEGNGVSDRKENAKHYNVSEEGGVGMSLILDTHNLSEVVVIRTKNHHSLISLLSLSCCDILMYEKYSFQSSTPFSTHSSSIHTQPISYPLTLSEIVIGKQLQHEGM
jgi:hypothetical protein